MTTLTIQIPPEIEQRLRAAAGLRNRTAQEEAVEWLSTEAKRRAWSEERLKRIDELHARHNFPPLDAEFVQRAIDEGRP